MRTTQWQRYLAASALLLSTLVVQAEVAPDTWNRVKALGVVRIGLQDKAAPFAYLDAQGKPAGFTWEICRAVVQTLAAELKRPIEIKATPVTLASSIEMLQDGRIDMQCGSTTHTLDRAQKVDFSNSFFVAGVVVSYRKEDLRYTNPSQFGRVGVVANSTAASAMGKRAAAKSGASIDAVVPVASYDEGMLRLKKKEIDTFVADGIFVPADPEIARRPAMETIEPYALVLRKGDRAFAAQVDRALARVLGSPAIRQMAANAKLDDRINTLTMEVWRRPSRDPAPQMY